MESAVREPRIHLLSRPLPLLATLALLALAASPAQAAAPPSIAATAAPTGVGADAATVRGSVDPEGSRTFVRFAYLTQAEFEAQGFAAARSTEVTLQATVKGSGELTKESKVITGLQTTSGTFAVGQEVKSTSSPGAISPGTKIAELATDPNSGEVTQLTLSQAAAASAAAAQLAATGPQPVAAQLGGLAPQTLYRFRIEAEHSGEDPVTGPGRVFATLAPSPAFGPCPNEAFRSGELSPPGHPSALLPDCRAYERATPADKDGGDAQGDPVGVKAAAQGGGVSFWSDFGMPGAQGAQEWPLFLASRGEGEWATRGLLPPAGGGEKAQVIGWSPDMTDVYTRAVRLGDPRAAALLVQSSGGPPRQLTPYALAPPGSFETEYSFVGASADGGVVVFESNAALPPAEGEAPIAAAHQGARNLYAWDRASGRLSLAGVMNDATSPAKGTLGGPYEWTEGINSQSLRLGGSFRGFYTQDEHAVSAGGSVFFTEVGSGQLYERLNPTQPQSPLNGQGECTDPALACTLHVSASEKTNGQGEGGGDGAGPQPAAFMAASAEGSVAFFTSPEKLTEDANTGPEQSPAQIERDDLAGAPVEEPAFLPRHAIGVAVDSSHVYWVDPKLGTIGRADLDGASEDPEFIVPGPVKCEVPGSEPPAFEEVPSHPRYLAVDAEHVYWTNTGCSDQFGPLDKTGTIGRADINGTEGSIEPEFITGASNPQGIAVNSEHIYWANAGRLDGVKGIARATPTGTEVEQSFFSTGNERPYGVALSPTHVYFASNEEGTYGYVKRILLEGGSEKVIFVGEDDVRGVAVDGSDVYWATQESGHEAIGRIPLADFSEPGGPCSAIPSCDLDFIPLNAKPNGLALDSSHLYWAANGEAPSNPGNDLYRYSAKADPQGHHLTDLTVEPNGDGAEVQAVVAASADGSYVYFLANAVLDEAGEGEPGSCSGTLGQARGSCSLYLWHEGQISLVVARMSGGDSVNWAATPTGQFGTSTYVPKTSFLSADGRTLLFRSQEQLTAYPSEGVPELYRFGVGEGISCASCPPSGEAAAEGPKLGRLLFHGGFGPSVAAASVTSRNLSADGNRVFFETAEALLPADTNGSGGCPLLPQGVNPDPSCIDVYEWEAPGSNSCTPAAPSYSPLNGGCLYLISSGKGKEPSLFADASASGDDVYFFTRDQLVGADTDSIRDVYDARVDGGLAAQNPVSSPPCENEGCKPAATPPPPYAAPPQLNGPGNPKPKRCKAKKGKAKHQGCGKGGGHKRHGKSKKQKSKQKQKLAR